MKPLSAVASAGSLLWILSEAVERTTGGIGSTSLALTTVAFATLAAGVWALRAAGAPSRSWDVAVALLSAGFALMSTISLEMWWIGATVHAEGLRFFVAVGLFAAGILATGALSWASARHPRWVGAAFTATGLLSIAANAAELGPAASATNVVLALLLVRMASTWTPSPAVRGEPA